MGGIVTQSSVVEKHATPSMDADELRLAQMGKYLAHRIFWSTGWEFGHERGADRKQFACLGHTQELKRHFSILSLIGLASTTTISWTGLGLGIVTEINAGGPGAIIYGFILVTIMQSFLGASLAEFVSSYPTEGGMYHWIAAVAPKRSSAFLSFLTGWLTVCGCEFQPPTLCPKKKPPQIDRFVLNLTGATLRQGYLPPPRQTSYLRKSVCLCPVEH